MQVWNYYSRGLLRQAILLIFLLKKKTSFRRYLHNLIVHLILGKLRCNVEDGVHANQKNVESVLDGETLCVDLMELHTTTNVGPNVST